ncbi:MAG: hypothetical protein IPK83_12165 [Planctomycetes bacterium]|nr:hypothetical protein [Planctomycetota bacterium]
MNYDSKAQLESFNFKLEIAGLSARVTGTRYDTEFACIAQVGDMTQTMALDGEVSRYLGDSLRPFTHLKGLRIGQTWRLRLIDPIALLRGSSVEFTTRLVKVVARETIEHGGEKVDCFRIETDGAVAWSNDAGQVLRQEVQVPLLGRWVITDEPFDDAKRLKAKKSMMTLRESRVGIVSGGGD